MNEKQKKYRIGIDMGGMSIKIGLVNEKNIICATNRIPTRLDIAPEELIQDMAESVRKLLYENQIADTDCLGIGIGSPGTVDENEGVVLYSNNFHWEQVAILSELRKYLKFELALANDADVAALGEQVAGAGMGCKNLILLTLGTGVGSGVILNGKIFHGPLRGGCELGHTVIQIDGEACTCGRRGCLEAYASATALMRMGREEAEKNPESLLNKYEKNAIDGKVIFDAQKAGDEAAKNVVERYETYLSVGIANFINIFRPERVVLGGGVAAQKEYLTDALQEKVNRLCFGGKYGQMAQITTSSLGNDAGIIGAANLIK
ncbi:MAG: ROK family protein [Lachnospiraceae bacterium]